MRRVPAAQRRCNKTYGSSTNASLICHDAAHPPQKCAAVAYTNQCAEKKNRLYDADKDKEPGSQPCYESFMKKTLPQFESTD